MAGSESVAFRDLSHLVELEGGGLQVSALPTEEELRTYYEEKYYQECERSAYEREYSEEEVSYFRNRARVSEFLWKRARNFRPGRYLDVGCGEGFSANYFSESGWDVTCIDYAEEGIRRHHPHLLPNLHQGDLIPILDGELEGQQFDFVELSHVLEHVREPRELIQRCASVMSPEGMLKVTVPNDYSPFQEELMRLEYTGETWFAPPDHLNYFNSNSLQSFLENCGWKIEHLLVDFPIESYLMNEHSNYAEDRSRGKAAYKCRIRIDNHLVDQGLDNYVAMMEGSAKCGFGRSVFAYVSLKD